MYTLDKIKKEIAKQINEALGQKIVQASDLVYPTKVEFGNLSLPCFNIAKKTGKTPVEMASWIISNFKIEEAVAGTKAIGPYVNFTFNRKYLVKEALNEVRRLKDEYGQNKSGKEKRVMIEYSNANTHKEYHVGHLRNICYGDAVNRILAANGYNSIPVSYVNDFGIHVAKTLWA